MDQYVTRASLQQLYDKWQQAFLRLNRGEPGITGLLSTAQAWEQCSTFLCPRPLDTYTFPIQRNFSSIAVPYEILDQVKLTSPLLDKLLDDFCKQKHLITEEIQRFLVTDTPDADSLLPITIVHLVQSLTMWYQAWRPPPELPLFCSSFQTAFQTHLYSTLPSSFNIGFKRLVRFTLDKTPSWSEDVTLPPSLLDFSIWRQFEVLGMIERYESIVHSVVYEYMEDYVEQECRGLWTEKLPSMNEWLTTELLPWLFHPFAQQARNHDEARSMVVAVCKQLQSQMIEMLGKLRIQEFFDVINDWPDSKGAVQDLTICLASSNLRSQFIKNLKSAQRERLLHPGTDTDTILGYYITTIRCLRLLDPLGSILHEIATPIRQYVRARPDTIRLIVDNLVREEDSLIDADEPVVPLQSAQVQDYSDENWMPEPKEAAPDFRSSKPLDIVSTLVSIYDSRDLFIKELQIMLAKRLQETKEGGLDNERRHVEILKVRFGESALQVCEVMLRDMVDSRRIDQHIQARAPMELHPTVISSHFWPSMQTTQAILPPRLQAMQDKYSHEFHLFKPDKRLRWLPLMGYVRIEVELEDRIIDKECSPLAAAVIELFLESPKLTVTELMTKLGMKDRQEVMKGVMAWVEEGVLDEVEGEEDKYEVLEYAKAEEDMRARPTVPAGAPEDEPSAVEAAQQQLAEQMRVYWKFIEGMLRNLGSLPLDRIQSMLKLAPGYDRTPEQLSVFMEAARREDLVIFADGKWRLRG